MRKIIVRMIAVGACLLICALAIHHRASQAASAGGAQAAKQSLGLFEDHGDVGTVLHAGAAVHDPATGSYTLTGSGENIWFSSDAFQFVWRKASADQLSLSADISFIGTGGHPHRKAVLMIRQSLDLDSVYADIALHGNGMTALQFRDQKGALTHEVQASATAPRRLELARRGDFFFLSLGDGPEVRLAAISPRIRLNAPFYVGIGVCAHDKDAVEKAVFSSVDLRTPGAASPALYSTLEIVPVASGERSAVYATSGRIEAPNWMPDGAHLIFNRDGRIERIAVEGGQPEIIDTGFARHCNNDHGISADGRWLAISDGSQPGGSRIYILPLSGGAPWLVTEHAPSYWHGWSPDGKTLAFCGGRDGKFDVYTIPVEGGVETQLTRNAGHNDGPEYSPDGKYIYLNSDRTGAMQIWRMRPDGSAQEQVTTDEFNNWFPHISPDGKLMVFLSYEKGVSGHPADRDVTLRFMTLADGKITVLAKLFGGQGTINVPSWSPDSKQVAFVSYAYY